MYIYVCMCQCGGGGGGAGLWSTDWTPFAYALRIQCSIIRSQFLELHYILGFYSRFVSSESSNFTQVNR